MGRGLNSYDRKQKRAMRRKNHIARDLGDRKYHQRRVDRKLKESKYKTWETDDE